MLLPKNVKKTKFILVNIFPHEENLVYNVIYIKSDLV